MATGLLTSDEAFQGFASPAVITMLPVFILSAGLQYTGVAEALGSRIHKVVGSREIPLIVAIMIVAGVLSAFMNNIAAAAVLLPAVVSLARKAGLAPTIRKPRFAHPGSPPDRRQPLGCGPHGG